jgi:mono/diheme cytochrome c family protein
VSLRALAKVGLLCAITIVACDSAPGKPSPADRPLNPAEVKDFAALYAGNCSGCHGADGQFGAGTPLRSPVLLALADDAVIERATAEGVPGTAMPAFAKRAGGMLDDEQVAILVKGMRERWSDPGKVAGILLPPYSAAAASAAGPSAGDVSRGAVAYDRYCASCHGEKGLGGERAGSIVDPSYLALVSDQGLRTTVIAGRPDLGMPDWRGYVEGSAMSPQEISDVVAWLVAQR